ncbi:MAG: DegV family protein [Candidatus Carbobacillus sp.]|nr:DegV family protein [Candidatus Carbobacillus sp.]
MRKTMVVTDSACDLPLEMIKQDPALRVIPFPKDGSISPLNLLSAYEPLLADASVTTIVSAHISGRISSLYERVTLALSTFKTDREMIVLDSGSLSLGQGLMVFSLLRCTQQKPMMRMCLDLWADSRIHTHVWIIQPADANDRFAPIWRLSHKLKERLSARAVQAVNEWGELSRGQIIRGRQALETMLEKAMRERLHRYGPRAYRFGLSVFEPDPASEGSLTSGGASFLDGWIHPSNALKRRQLAHIPVETWQSWLIDRFQPLEVIVGSMSPALATYLRLAAGTVAIAVSPAYDDPKAAQRLLS